jgi:hypothetical protein
MGGSRFRWSQACLQRVKKNKAYEKSIASERVVQLVVVFVSLGKILVKFMSVGGACSRMGAISMYDMTLWSSWSFGIGREKRDGGGES